MEDLLGFAPLWLKNTSITYPIVRRVTLHILSDNRDSQKAQSSTCAYFIHHKEMSLKAYISYPILDVLALGLSNKLGIEAFTWLSIFLSKE